MLNTKKLAPYGAALVTGVVERLCCQESGLAACCDTGLVTNQR